MLGRRTPLADSLVLAWSWALWAFVIFLLIPFARALTR